MKDDIRSFASDNFSGVHPDILTAITEANRGHTIAYGGDPWTAKAEKLFKRIFGSDAEAFIVYNGTAANVCLLKQALRTWQSVISPGSAHIWTDECGAVQSVAGCSIIPVPCKNGKLDPESLLPMLNSRGSQHHVQPGALSITQSTELGTLYTIKELKRIGEFAHQNKLLFHIDGARLYNAAAALNVSLEAISTDIGADLLSLGGTKNGLMGAEAVVFLKPGLSENFQYLRKQHLQLASKMRFLSAQYIALLENDLWLKNARHANAMAKLLEEKLRRQFPNIPILYPVEANALFVQIPSHAIKQLQEKYFFWIWDEEQSIVRWMTSWDTQPEWIDDFISHLSGYLK